MGAHSAESWAEESSHEELPAEPDPAVSPWGDPVCAAIMRMVLYFDVFKHPLTLGELERLVAPGRRGEVVRACDELEAHGLLEARGAHRFRPGMARFVDRRRQRSAWAEEAWPWACGAAGVLARLPFVRGVLITGGLSKQSTDPSGDIDFLLLVQPGRVWTLKTGLQAARRALPHRVRELACTNYLLSTDALLVDDRNIFTAVELATAIPMYGQQACLELLEANRWAARHVPGLDWSLERVRTMPPEPPRRLARAVELAWVDGVARAVERASLGFMDRYWNRKYDWLDDRTRSQRFKRREDLATNHLHDFQLYVLREVEERLREVGLDAPVMDTPIPAAT